MTLLTVDKLISQGRGLAAALLKRAASVSLDWQLRQTSHFDSTDSAGRALGVRLPPGSKMRGGDVLVAEDGSLVTVVAALQPVLVVRACADHGSAADLARAAYHLGTRHVALELQPDHLKLEPHPVLAEMLRQWHLTVAEATEPFEPEDDASAAGSHGHGHGAAHGPAAALPRPVAIAVRAAAAPHVHGPGCNHGHGH